MKTARFRTASLDLLAYAAGGAVYAVGVTVFLAPNGISPGGVTGVATALQQLIHTPVGGVVLLLNLPILLLGLAQFGRRFILRTATATVFSAAALELVARLAPPRPTDRILAALFGGLLAGAGMSLVFLRGATTGGVDILAKYLNARLPQLSVGRLLLLMDVAVVAFSAYVYRDFESALYSALAISVSSNVIDRLLYGSDSGKLMLLITSQPDALAAAIFSQLGRGVTRLQATGGYTNAPRTMLLCAVRRHEAARLRALVRRLDEQAFFLLLDVGEIFGEGFRRPT